MAKLVKAVGGEDEGVSRRRTVLRFPGGTEGSKFRTWELAGRGAAPVCAAALLEFQFQDRAARSAGEFPSAVGSCRLFQQSPSVTKRRAFRYSVRGVNLDLFRQLQKWFGKCSMSETRFRR
jgi:hypothetical protein